MGNAAQFDRRQMMHSVELRSRSSTGHLQRTLPANMPPPQHAESGASGQSVGNMGEDPAAEAEGNAAKNAVDDAPADDTRSVLINDDQGGPTQGRSTRGPGRPRKRVDFNFARNRNSPSTPPAADSGPQGTRPEETTRKEVRRSTRDKNRAQLYDASTGKSVDPSLDLINSSCFRVSGSWWTTRIGAPGSPYY